MPSKYVHTWKRPTGWNRAGTYRTGGGGTTKPRQLTAHQVARLGRGAPFHPTKGLDGAVGTGAWSWERDQALQSRAASFNDVAEARFLQVATQDAVSRFRETGDMRLVDSDVRSGVSRGDLRQFRRMQDDAKAATREWGAHRRQFERSIGLFKRGSRSRPMALGYVEGFSNLVRLISEHEPDLMKDWIKEMGSIVQQEVVPPTKRKAPVSGELSDYLEGRARTKLTVDQAAARRAYVYPDNRAAPGQGTRRVRPGSLKKSVRKRVTKKEVGITVGGTKSVPYAGPTIWGWEVRNRQPNNFLWAAIQENLEDVTRSLLDYAEAHARRYNVKLNYQQKRSPSEWKAANVG